MTVHRFWRLQSTGSNRGYFSCASLEMHAAIGGPDATGNPGGVPIGSDAYGGSPGGYGIEKAFDRDPATAYSSASGNPPQFIGWDFGAGNEVDILEMVYLPRSGDAAASPNSGTIDWSDDGIAWHKRANVVAPGGGYSDGTPVTFASPQPRPGFPQYWRVRALTADGDLLAAAEIGFHAVVGGPTVVAGQGAAIASSAYSAGYSPAYAFDGSTSGAYWVSAGNAPGVEWIGYDFGSPANGQAIVEATWTARSGDTARAPGSVAVEWSDDEAAWTTLLEADGLNPWTDGETKTFGAAPASIPQRVSKLAAYVVEGPPSIPQAVSKLGQYVVEGATATQYVSKLAAYVVEGSPSEARNLSQAMMGSF